MTTSVLLSNRLSLLLFSFLLNPASCQTASTLVLGVGIGTLIIIIAIVFAIVWCLACRSSSRPEFYSLLGLVLPVVLILAFVFTPK